MKIPFLTLFVIILSNFVHTTEDRLFKDDFYLYLDNEVKELFECRDLYHKNKKSDRYNCQYCFFLGVESEARKIFNEYRHFMENDAIKLRND